MKRVIWIVAFMSCSHSYANKDNLASFEVLRERYTNIIECINVVDPREKNPNVPIWISTACRYIEAMEKRDERVALPFLEEVTFSTNTIPHIRERAARAYLKIADWEESVNLLVQYCGDPTIERGKWSMVQLYIDKLNASDINSIAPETKDYINTCLLKILLTTDVRDVGNRLNIHLLNAIPFYSNSIQRATLTRFATEGNEWVTNTFQPIKAHFDTLPKSKLVDLRRQFPELPPLPSEKEGGMTWVYGVGGLMLVVVCLAAGFRCFRRESKKGG